MSLTDNNNRDAQRSEEGPFLVLYRGDARLEVVEMPPSGRFTIGRAPSNRVIVPDAKCSRQHCELFSREDRWHLRDLDSRNGVTVDGIRVKGERLLEFGETIGIGNCALLLTNVHPDAAGDSKPQSSPSRNAPYEIIERKSGTQYDGDSGLQRLQTRRDGATDLFRIARAMAATTTPEELCRVVLDGLCALTGADIGGILLLSNEEDVADPPALTPVVVRGGRQPASFSSFLSQIAIDDRDAILAHDISRHSALSGQDSLQELAAESAICAPIRHEGIAQGVIHLYSTRSNAPLTQSDLEFVLAVSDQMGDQLYSLQQREQLEFGLERVRQQVSELHDQLAAETELVGHSETLKDVRRAIARVSPTDALVLIRGESGVGKELVARAVHFNSLRKDGPFVCVNCAALSESLLESELFGHEKGAFTGASSKRAGKFEQANGGSIFLDEIGEMSPEIQAKFLRVLEGQAFERVGGSEPIRVDVRVITATNRDLEEAVREGQFRRDLFFRLQVIEMFVPPLREHPEDIPAIANHFVSRFAVQAHRKIRGFNADAIQKLQAHNWPGNVRELKNVVERAVILADHEILGPADVALTKLRLDVEDAGSDQHSNTTIIEHPPQYSEPSLEPSQDHWETYVKQKMSLDEIDRIYIEAVLDSTGWNKSKASRILQIERTTLDRRLKKYGMSRPGDDEDDN